MDRVVSLRTFASIVALFIKKRMDDTVEKWRLTAKNDLELTNRKLDTLAFPSPIAFSGSHNYRIATRDGNNDVEQMRKIKKDKRRDIKPSLIAKYVPPFSTSSSPFEARLSDL